jgi:hypothetical protein
VTVELDAGTIAALPFGCEPAHAEPVQLRSLCISFLLSRREDTNVWTITHRKNFAHGDHYS